VGSTLSAAKANGKSAATIPSATPARKKRSAKGRLIAMIALLRPSFRRSLREALVAVKADVRALGLKTEQELRDVLVEAHRRLEGETKKITATAWVGKAFEIIGSRLPEVAAVEGAAAQQLLRLVNGQIRSGGAGFHFTNGYLEPAGVRRTFATTPTQVHSVWIRGPHQPKGGEYVDRGLLFINTDGQALFVSTEFKTRGAAGELRGQVATRDARAWDAPHREGTRLSYQIEGSPDVNELDLEKVILIGPNSPELLRAATLFTKIGTRPGSRAKVSVATDARGEPYLRLIVPVATDPLRRSLERVLRDRSWQG
jgi:hypothetical protein